MGCAPLHSLSVSPVYASRLRHRIAAALLAVFVAGGVVGPSWHGVEHAAEAARQTHTHASADAPVLADACETAAPHGPDCFVCQRTAWARLGGARMEQGLGSAAGHAAAAPAVPVRLAEPAACPRAPPPAA